MSDFIHTDESDPNAIASRKDDEQGSFLSLYRSVSAAYVPMDEFVVRGSVDCGVIPSSVRYGVMARGRMQVYRGAVKSTNGELWYFNYAPGADFKLVKAEETAQQTEVSRLLKTCPYGCDINKGTAKAPLESGETIEEAALGGTEHDPDDEETEKGAIPIPSAGNTTVSEDRNIQDQERLQTDVHPGGTASQLPEEQGTGRDWHEPIVRAQDGLAPLASNDGKQYWNRLDLLKAYGQTLQQTAPRLAPPVSSLEQQYMQEQMGVPPDQLSKGLRLAPRHRIGFEQWKARRLREKLAGLQSYLGTK